MASEAFPLPLILEALSNGRKDHWRLVQAFAFVDGTDVYVAPPGFANDLASIPRVFWPILDPTNDVAPGATIHDWLYATRGFVCPGLPRISRAKADAIFYRALRANGVGYLRAKAMWSAVRIGGGKAWRNGMSPEALLTLEIYSAALQSINPGPEAAEQPERPANVVV